MLFDFLQNEKNPIFVSTLVKSGTHMLELILELITNKRAYEPTQQPYNGYKSEKPIKFPKGTFFIWHSVITEKVSKKINNNSSKVIFLTRNIYDLIISEYYHHLNNVDGDINPNNDVSSYFKENGKARCIDMLINGSCSKEFIHDGVRQHLNQLRSFIEYSKENICFFINYDLFIKDKEKYIKKLSKFINIDLNEQQIAFIKEHSDFKQMKLKNTYRGIKLKKSDHIRKGETKFGKTELSKKNFEKIHQIINSEYKDIKRRLEKDLLILKF